MLFYRVSLGQQQDQAEKHIIYIIWSYYVINAIICQDRMVYFGYCHKTGFSLFVTLLIFLFIYSQ